MFATRWGELGRNVTNVSDSYERVCNGVGELGRYVTNVSDSYEHVCN